MPFKVEYEIPKEKAPEAVAPKPAAVSSDPVSSEIPTTDPKTVVDKATTKTK